MAASKKAPASSKTAHVMNLLSKSASPSDEAPAGALEEPQAAPAPAANANKPPIIVSLSSDAAVSEQIRDALETALETDGGEPSAPAAEPEPEPEPAAEEAAAEPEPEPVAEEAVAEPEPEPVAEEAAAEPEPEPVAKEAADPEPEPVAEEAAAEPEPEPVAEEAADPEPEPAAEEAADPALDTPVPEMPAPLSPVAASPITCVNVMQVLVDENAEKYVKMFGLCQCPHCMADVKALALNNLQPKYVVMENGHVVPRISVYEGRYQAAITAQLLRACTTVMEQPRHERPL